MAGTARAASSVFHRHAHQLAPQRAARATCAAVAAAIGSVGVVIDWTTIGWALPTNSRPR